MKKILIIWTLLIASLCAFEPHFYFDTINGMNRGEIYVMLDREAVLNGEAQPQLDPNPKDWVGIYEEGASNAWKNVKQWLWVKPNLAGNKTFVPIKLKLSNGNYEARYFLNNSYTTYKAKKFTVQSHTPTLSLKFEKDFGVIFEASRVGSAWIGIYPEGSTNAWKNVIEWAWVKNLDNPIFKGTGVSLYRGNLHGTYDVRLFYNNSYHVEKQIKYTYYSPF